MKKNTKEMTVTVVIGGILLIIMATAIRRSQYEKTLEFQYSEKRAQFNRGEERFRFEQRMLFASECTLQETGKYLLEEKEKVWLSVRMHPRSIDPVLVIYKRIIPKTEEWIASQEQDRDAVLRDEIVLRRLFRLHEMLQEFARLNNTSWETHEENVDNQEHWEALQEELSVFWNEEEFPRFYRDYDRRLL